MRCKTVRYLILLGLCLLPEVVLARETAMEKREKLNALRSLLVALERDRLELASLMPMGPLTGPSPTPSSPPSPKSAVVALTPLTRQQMTKLWPRIKVALDALRQSTKGQVEVENILRAAGVDLLADKLNRLSKADRNEAKQDAGNLRVEEIQQVSRALRDTVSRLLDGFEMELAPSQTPQRSKIQAIYAAQCASCHGAQGDGDGELAKRMPVPVPSFLATARMQQATPAYFYNIILLGSPNKAMPAFDRRLDSDTIWGMAHLLLGKRYEPAFSALNKQPPNEKQKGEKQKEPPRWTLTDLARYDDEQIEEKFGREALAKARVDGPFSQATKRH